MKNYLSLIKFSHTIFALPFALIGFTLGVVNFPGLFSYKILLLVLGCMIFARSAAMAFNRYVDHHIDAKNPRTAIREIPAGILERKNVLVFIILNALAFVVCTFFINRLCFYLSPVALLIVLGYSYTKRFTALCHLVLGLGLALAPIGSYIAVTGRFDLIPVLFGLVVLMWVSGFDIIYALQDEEFDLKHQLRSTPVLLGKEKALLVSSGLHFLAISALISIGFIGDALIPNFGLLQWIGISLFSVLIIYQHSLVSPNDLSKINLAFFTTNGVASVLFAAFYILDLML